MELLNQDGIEYLNSLKDNSIDLILTDPPYIISRDSGMNKLADNINNNVNLTKTKEEWLEYKKKHNLEGNKDQMDKFLKYGTIYSKKFAVKTKYGKWDEDFTIDKLTKFIKLYYKKLRKGGTCIIWFDLWKLETLKILLENIGKTTRGNTYGFKQIRFIEWVKTNPQPINSKINYLSNCREVAILCVKGGKPTFNSKYDKGIYQYPLQGGKDRFHPTQKSLDLFIDLIKKHSNEGDIVLDTFSGGGTTALACMHTNRKFKGCELDKGYYDKSMEIIKKYID